jgi:hypothetical protein
MKMSKRFGTWAAAAALVAVGVFALPGHAEAWWGWRGGVRVWIPGPIVVARPPVVVYAPPRPVYVAPPVVYAGPPVVYGPRVWVPGYWRGPVWVQGYWR